MVELPYTCTDNKQRLVYYRIEKQLQNASRRIARFVSDSNSRPTLSSSVLSSPAGM